MRARRPDASGVVNRAGTGVYWERFGDSGQPMLLLQTDPIVESWMWKAQIPWFARRHAIVTFDPRGTGRSDRPTDPSAYADREFTADAIAVLDTTGIDRVVIVGLCQSAGVALTLATENPDRVAGVVAINPALNVADPHPHRAPGGFDNAPTGDHGWQLENRRHWERDWDRYCRFFFAEMLPEPHSSKQREDCVDWALSATAITMLAYRSQPPAARHDRTTAQAICRSVRCPVLVICGDEDMCQPPERGRRVAELTGAEFVVIEGAGHLPQARDPVKVNLEIGRFARQVAFAEARRLRPVPSQPMGQPG